MDRKLRKGWFIDLLEAEEESRKDIREEREQALASQLREMRTRSRRLVDPLQYAVSIADEDLSDYTPTFAWEMGPPSEKQMAFLEKSGIAPSSVPNKGMAKVLIDRLLSRREEGLSSPKQIRCLERYGFRHVGTWSFDDASRMIGILAGNDWKVPRGLVPATYEPGA